MSTPTIYEHLERVQDECNALHQQNHTMKAELAEERAIVSRIWEQLESPSYAELAGRSIYDLIDELKKSVAVNVGNFRYVSKALAAKAEDASRLRAALEFYANEDNWMHRQEERWQGGQYGCMRLENVGESEAEKDFGDKARQALAPARPEENK